LSLILDFLDGHTGERGPGPADSRGWELKKHEWPNRGFDSFRAGELGIIIRLGDRTILLLQADFLQRIKDKGRPVEAFQGKAGWTHGWTGRALLPALPAGLAGQNWPKNAY